VPLNRSDVDWLFTACLLRQSCPSARLVGLQRVQWPKLWDEFARYRDDYLSGDANERLLFHGTGSRLAAELFAHPFGLDPRFSSGGFYGQGIYLAEDASYPIGGRYAHRLAGSGGTRLQLLLVRANLGKQQELGQRIDTQTRAMKMPDVQSHGSAGARFHSVCAGPHRPFQSGTRGSSIDASVIHVVYESRQLYPQYVLEVEFDLAPELAATLASAAAEAPPSNAKSSAASGSGAPAAATVPTVPAGDLEALVAALVDEGPPADKTKVVVALCELFAGGGEAAKEAVAAAGGIEVLVALVRDGLPEGKRAAADALGRLALRHDGRSASIAVAGGIEALVEGWGSWALGHLAANHTGRNASIAAAGGIEALVALVRDGWPEGKKWGSNALGHLAHNHDGRSASIAAAGGIEVLVALVRDGSPEGKEDAAAALGYLARRHEGRKESIVAVGGIEALMALVRDGLPGGKTSAADALGYLADEHEGRKESIAAAGGIEALVALIRDGSPDGKRAAADALGYLALEHDGRSSSIAATGGVEALVALARDGSPDGKAMAAEALHVLAYNHDGRSASIAAAGGIETLEALVRDGSPGKAAAAATLGIVKAAWPSPG